MYDYIKGTVTYLKNNAIVLDNNGVGYLIYVSNPYSFNVNEDYKVYVYQKIAEDEHCLYGFSAKQQHCPNCDLVEQCLGISFRDEEE